MSNSKLYSIPDRFRRIENLHIVFWLLKDISWAMLWKPIGLAMFVPTISVAILITWQTRKLISELYHNLAIVCWIIANGYWMISEFFWPSADYLRYYASIPFSVGIIFISAYYFIILPAERRKQKMVTVPMEVPETILQEVKK
jgi:hypothetical protein